MIKPSQVWAMLCLGSWVDHGSSMPRNRCWFAIAVTYGEALTKNKVKVTTQVVIHPGRIGTWWHKEILSM